MKTSIKIGKLFLREQYLVTIFGNDKTKFLAVAAALNAKVFK